MIFWHLGATALMVRYVFRDPAMDLRWPLLGALLPDLIDKPLGSVLFVETFGSDRLFAHALVFPVVLMAGAVAATSRGSVWRKRLVGVVVGALLHLVLDGAWNPPEAFWWPFFGWEFPTRPHPALGELVESMVRDWRVWVGEALGVGYLVYLRLRYLRTPAARVRFTKEGSIPLPAHPGPDATS